MRTRPIAITCAVMVTISMAAPSRPSAHSEQRAVAAAGQDQPAAPKPAAPAADPKLQQYKRDVGLEVDGMREDIQRMNDQVFSFGELGFQEFETSKYLTGILEKNGFTVQ